MRTRRYISLSPPATPQDRCHACAHPVLPNEIGWPEDLATSENENAPILPSCTFNNLHVFSEEPSPNFGHLASAPAPALKLPRRPAQPVFPNEPNYAGNPKKANQLSSHRRTRFRLRSPTVSYPASRAAPGIVSRVES